jgi:hypothetical protein
MSMLDAMDELQNDRLNSIDDRLRNVEAAVVELATMAKWMRYAVIIMAGGFGYDLTGMI